eukprot:3927495-Rhodomonas_salina.1
MCIRDSPSHPLPFAPPSPPIPSTCPRSSAIQLASLCPFRRRCSSSCRRVGRRETVFKRDSTGLSVLDRSTPLPAYARPTPCPVPVLTG